MQDIGKILKQTMKEKQCDAIYAFLCVSNKTSEKHKNSVVAKRK